jgi:putative membrane protein
MTEETEKPLRKPQIFSVEEEPERRSPTNRKPDIFDPGIVAVTAADPFDPEPNDTMASPRPRWRFPLFSIAASAFGLLLSVATGLWIDRLIHDLFTRADWLGYLAVAVTAIGALATSGIVMRELYGLRRLTSIQNLKRDAELAALDQRPVHARSVVDRLTALAANLPETAKGRAALEKTAHEIIDAEGLLRLAEVELLEPADRKARQLILAASRRVSIVTAVSPRALVDLGYVIFEAARLIRAIAETYGTRPGRIGMLKLFRDVIAHLAVTGSIALGDGLAQQVLGHGLASKLSARLGEGVINGLMTARIGIAAMDLLRPLPFKALRRPGVGDFLSDLTTTQNTKQ